MNTFCSIRADADDPDLAGEGIEEAFSELKRVESLFSRYADDSEITKINQDASAFPVEVDAEVFSLLARSLEFSRMTQGAFDITIGTAVDLWRLSGSKNMLPNQGEIEELRGRAGFKNIVLDLEKQSIYFARPGMRVDLGALAKGYGLERAKAILRERGITEAQINLGGNIYVISSRPQAIAIRNPIFPEEVVTSVDLADEAISTSANYERFFTIRGRRFGHLLDPLTGSPAKTDILSASVISPDAALADALSTAIFVLGLKKGSETLKGIRGCEAIIICGGRWGKKVKIYKMKGGSESEGN